MSSESYVILFGSVGIFLLAGLGISRFFGAKSEYENLLVNTGVLILSSAVALWIYFHGITAAEQSDKSNKLKNLISDLRVVIKSDVESQSILSRVIEDFKQRKLALCSRSPRDISSQDIDEVVMRLPNFLSLAVISYPTFDSISLPRFEDIGEEYHSLLEVIVYLRQGSINVKRRSSNSLDAFRGMEKLRDAFTKKSGNKVIIDKTGYQAAICNMPEFANNAFRDMLATFAGSRAMLCATAYAFENENAIARRKITDYFNDIKALNQSDPAVSQQAMDFFDTLSFGDVSCKKYSDPPEL